MELTLQYLIQHYGYLAILIGTFLEGETVLVLAGFAAHRGYLELPWVLLMAFLGSMSGDQLYFYLGRRHGSAILARCPQWKPQAEQVHALLERYRALLIVGNRFMYGLRLVGPFVMGMSRVPAGQFTFLNTLGALLWASVIGSAGYFLGQSVEALLGSIEHIEQELMLGIAGVGLAIWLAHHLRRRWRKEK